MILVALRMPDGVPGLFQVDDVKDHVEAMEVVKESFPTAVAILALVTK